MKNRMSVRDLAKEADLGIDEALLQLWEIGIGSVTRPSDVLVGNDLKSALRVFGIPTRRQVVSSEYWQERLRLTREELEELLARYGIDYSQNTHRLPKGAPARLIAETRRRKKAKALPNIAEELQENGQKPARGIASNVTMPQGLTALVAPAPVKRQFWQTIGHERVLVQREMETSIAELRIVKT